MSKKEYTEQSVVRDLNRFKTVDINHNSKTIYVIKDNSGLGNGSWGKISYLVKVHGYKQCYVTNLSKSKSPVNADNIENNKPIVRNNKRDKLNMVNMAKDIMRKNKKY